MNFFSYSWMNSELSNQNKRWMYKVVETIEHSHSNVINLKFSQDFFLWKTKIRFPRKLIEHLDFNCNQFIIYTSSDSSEIRRIASTKVWQVGFLSWHCDGAGVIGDEHGGIFRSFLLLGTNFIRVSTSINISWSWESILLFLQLFKFS